MPKCKSCKKDVVWSKFGAHSDELKSGLCSQCLDKPFPITSVCRADLMNKFTPEQIAEMDDGDMTHLASKMADAYCDSSFWIDLEIIAESILDDKK